jgi:integrase
MTAIRKRVWTNGDGSQSIKWLVDYKDQSGKRRFRNFDRKRDAEVWITQAAWEVSQGVHTADSQSINIAEACDMWVKTAELNDRERGTIQQYRQLADLHIKPLLGAEKLSRLTRPQTEAFRDQLLQTRSKAMTGKAVRALSGVLREAMRRGLLAQNVAADVKVSRSSRERPKVIIPTSGELRSLLENADDDLRPLLMTAVMTGLRSSELRGLPWSDVNLKAGSITVSQRADKYCQIGPPKSAAGYRTIPIGSALVTLLKEWKLRCPKGDLGLVFPNTVGGVQDYPHLLRRKFFPLQIASGVCGPDFVDGKPKLDTKGDPLMKARYGMHALRHAAASAWIKQRIDIKRLQVWIGHENIELTIDTYGHLIEDPESDVALIVAVQEAFLS